MTHRARVIANLRTSVAVQLDGESKIEQGHALRSLPLLVAGDVVETRRDAAGVLRIEKLIPRKSALERVERRGVKPLAANLTHLAVVSADPPGIDTLLIDQFCLAAHHARVNALIIINKCDLFDEVQRRRCDDILAVYRDIGYTAISIDTRSDAGFQPLRDKLGGRALTLVGASGSGKSSIVKRLLPDRELRIGAVSAATGFGAHTTSVTFWYDLPNGGAIIDSPGVRQYSVAHMPLESVRDGYRDLAQFARHCRFGDCRHSIEPGCAVREALERGQIAGWRFQNYCKLAALA